MHSLPMDGLSAKEKEQLERARGVELRRAVAPTLLFFLILTQNVPESLRSACSLFFHCRTLLNRVLLRLITTLGSFSFSLAGSQR